jgi:hypothetical protein
VPSEKGIETDHWAVFDDGLDQAEEALEVARTRYRGLSELNAPLPDSFAGALDGLEEAIKEINGVLDVSKAEATEAQAVAEKASLLRDVLDASWQYYSGLVDTELEIYECWASNLGDRFDGEVQTVSQDIEAFHELAANDNYGQLYSGHQFTVASVRTRLERHDVKARKELTAIKYVQHCIAAATTLETEFMDDVKRLVRAGEPLRIKRERSAVSNRVDELQDAVDDGTLDEEAPAAARTALEGAMMLRYRTAYAVLGYEYRQRLSDLVTDVDDAEESVVARIEECEVNELLIAIEQAVIDEATRSINEQVTALLREHDGSLDAALAGSELDPEQFFDTLCTAFVEGELADIWVRFE